MAESLGCLKNCHKAPLQPKTFILSYFLREELQKHLYATRYVIITRLRLDEQFKSLGI